MSVLDNEIKVLSKLADDGSTYWTAYYPSIPECAGGGSTAEEAINEAKENLKVYLEFLEKRENEHRFER